MLALDSFSIDITSYAIAAKMEWPLVVPTKIFKILESLHNRRPREIHIKISSIFWKKYLLGGFIQRILTKLLSIRLDWSSIPPIRLSSASQKPQRDVTRSGRRQLDLTGRDNP